jgi:hypothetical protein
VLKVVSYYTNDFYRQRSIALTRSLDRHGVYYEVSYVKGKTSWVEAVCHKPQFIAESLVRSSCDLLVWTDADSILERPIPFEELGKGDIAFVGWQRSPHHDREYLTGTMVFKNSTRVRDFVEEWAHLTPTYRNTFTPEQMSLKELLSQKTEIAIQELDPSWCFIQDDMREMYPNAKEIFRHTQASRTYKEIERKAAEEAELSRRLAEKESGN